MTPFGFKIVVFIYEVVLIVIVIIENINING